MKRSPMKRNTQKAIEWQRRKRSVLANKSRRNGLNPVGKRGRRRQAEWAKAKAVYLAEHPTCEFESAVAVHQHELEASFDFRCGGQLDVHHVIPRQSGGGKDYGVYATLCRSHHSWVETNREAARSIGLLMRVPTQEGK